MSSNRKLQDYNLGIRLTRKNKTVFAGVASFLIPGLILGTTINYYALAPGSISKAPNCLVRHRCDSSWTMVSPTMGDALAGTDLAAKEDRVYQDCMIQTGTRTIVCPWGETIILSSHER